MFSDSDRAAVVDAIAAAEARTSGEIVVVVSERADRYPATGLTVAALLAFAVPLGLTLAGVGPDGIAASRGWSAGNPAADFVRAVEAYAAVQVAIFAAVAALLLWTPLGAGLTPRALKRDRVRGEALAQFRARGIGATAARTGVLIYVSLPDHLAEVVADGGIYARVPPEHWGTTVAALVAGIKRGAPAAGFVEAIALAGAVLAEHFPRGADDRDELPNRLVEI